jgi:hypothetical protein
LKYSTLEKLFIENKLEEVLELYSADFLKADEYANLFTNNALSSSTLCQEALEVLTGLYMRFNTAYQIAEYQYLRKKEICKTHKIDDEGLLVLNYLRIKNIFKMYCVNTKRAIGSCQSQLKFFISEIQLSR